MILFVYQDSFRRYHSSHPRADRNYTCEIRRIQDKEERIPYSIDNIVSFFTNLLVQEYLGVSLSNRWFCILR